MRQPSNLKITNVLYVAKGRYEPGHVRFGHLKHNELVFYFSGSRTKYFGDTVLKEQGVTLEYLPLTGNDEDYSLDIYEHGACIDIFFDCDLCLFDTAQAFCCERSGAELESAFSRILSLWRLKPEGFEYECLSLFYRILSVMFRLENQPYLPSKAAQQLRPAEEYIKEHFADREFDYSVLHKSCGIGYTYFKKLFLQKYGVTPVVYITGLRMSLAADLLSSGLYTVTDAAGQCGYETPYYFCRVFKKHYGVPPSQYHR